MGQQVVMAAYLRPVDGESHHSRNAALTRPGSLEEGWPGLLGSVSPKTESLTILPTTASE